MFSTSGDVQYIRGCSVHRGDIIGTWGDIIGTSGGYHEYTGGVQYIGRYHEYIRDIMSTLGDVQYIRGIS